MRLSHVQSTNMSRPETNLINPDPLKEAQKQTETLCIQLMDAMKASVPKNGQFFTELGNASIGQSADTRALILHHIIATKTIEAEYKTLHTFVAITRCGVKKLSVSQFEFDWWFGPSKDKQRISFRTITLPESTLSFLDIPGQDGGPFLLDIKTDKDRLLVNEAMTKSIEESGKRMGTFKVKDAIDLSAEKLNHTLANDLFGILNDATPKTRSSPGTAV